jgi:hypothetical protein
VRKLQAIIPVLLLVGCTAPKPDAAKARSLVSAVSSSILPADRATLWRPGVPNGIPNRTTICATVSPGGDIQAAINACPEGQVVQLTAGKWALPDQAIKIQKAITLRGMGPSQTEITKANASSVWPVIELGDRWVNGAASVNLTIDAEKESNWVRVASAAGYNVGDLVLLDQEPIPGVTFYSAICPDGSACQTWNQRKHRPVSQSMEIASIVENVVTFSTPFHITFAVSNKAQLTRFERPAIKGGGLEDLKVSFGRQGDSGGNIYMEGCVRCWVKNVESYMSDGGSLHVYRGLQNTIRDSYFHETVNPTPGGAGYGVDISSSSADNLVENNIIWSFNKCFLMRSAGGGNVIAYNYIEDGFGSFYKSFVEAGLNASHMTTSHFELFEGNQAFNFDSEGRYGSAYAITYFRNHSTTLRRSLGGLGLTDDGNRFGAKVVGRHYFYSFIGNVFGQQGMPGPGGLWAYEKIAQPYNSLAIFTLGAPDADNIIGVGPGQSDPKVAETIFRAGNFEYAGNQIHWENAPEQTLPDSLYLTSKPAFFGSNPWPWVDAAGTTKLYTLPARARMDSPGYPGSGVVPPTPGPTPPGPTPLPTPIPSPVAIPARININGPAVTVGGVSFAAETGSGLAITGGLREAGKDVSQVAASAEERVLLSTVVANYPTGPTLLQLPVAAGDYRVYLHHWEDNEPMNFGLQLEQSVIPPQSTGSTNTWNRIGPYPVHVTDGSLTITVTGGHAMLGAIEVELAGATPLPTPTPGGVPTPSPSVCPTSTPCPTPAQVGAQGACVVTTVDAHTLKSVCTTTVTH